MAVNEPIPREHSQLIQYNLNLIMNSIIHRSVIEKVHTVAWCNDKTAQHNSKLLYNYFTFSVCVFLFGLIEPIHLQVLMVYLCILWEKKKKTDNALTTCTYISIP